GKPETQELSLAAEGLQEPLRHAGSLRYRRHRSARISALPIRHPGESRDPLNTRKAGGAARVEIIKWVPTFVGMTVCEISEHYPGPAHLRLLQTESPLYHPSSRRKPGPPE